MFLKTFVAMKLRVVSEEELSQTIPDIFLLMVGFP